MNLVHIEIYPSFTDFDSLENLQSESVQYKQIIHFFPFFSNMNDDQQLLLTDSPSLSPKRSCNDPEEQLLLLGCSQIQISTANNTFSLTKDLKTTFHQSDLFGSTQLEQQKHFILQHNESSQEEEITIQHIEMGYKMKQKLPVKAKITFDYTNLINKLELALQRIKEKESKKLVHQQQKQKQDKSQYIPILKRIKTPQLRRQYSQEDYQLSNSYRKNSLKRRITTQPDERVCPFQLKQKANMQKYKTDRIINQQTELQNPPPLTKRNGENLRSKKQFLASVANWQQMKVLKQKERIQKQKQLAMVGVTFTPEINAKSKLLMKKKGQIVPIYQRDVRTKKVEPEHLPPKYGTQKSKK